MRPMNDVTPEASKNHASSAAAKRRFAQQYPKFNQIHIVLIAPEFGEISKDDT